MEKRFFFHKTEFSKIPDAVESCRSFREGVMAAYKAKGVVNDVIHGC